MLESKTGTQSKKVDKVGIKYPCLFESSMGAVVLISDRVATHCTTLVTVEGSTKKVGERVVISYFSRLSPIIGEKVITFNQINK